MTAPYRPNRLPRTNVEMMAHLVDRGVHVHKGWRMGRAAWFVAIKRTKDCGTDRCTEVHLNELQVAALGKLKAWETSALLRVLRVVSQRTGISPERMLGRERVHDVGRARRLGIFAAHRQGGLKVSLVAAAFNRSPKYVWDCIAYVQSRDATERDLEILRAVHDEVGSRS